MEFQPLKAIKHAFWFETTLSAVESEIKSYYLLVCKNKTHGSNGSFMGQGITESGT